MKILFIIMFLPVCVVAWISGFVWQNIKWDFNDGCLVGEQFRKWSQSIK
jgi:hypothetical protein